MDSGSSYGLLLGLLDTARAFWMLQSTPVYPLKQWQIPAVVSQRPLLLHWLIYSYDPSEDGLKWKRVTIPVLSDHVVPSAAVSLFSGSAPLNPSQPRLASTSIT